MMVEFYCPQWGSAQLSRDLFFGKVAAAGYDGVEYGIAAATASKELDEVWNLASKHKLKIIAQHYDTYEPEFSRHYDLFNAWLEKMRPYPCVKVNSQTGKDFFSFEQNASLMRSAMGFTEKTGIQVLHETHRNKCLFAAHISQAYLEQLPGLNITLDASHWVCVAESFLEDQEQAMDLAIERTEHIHARVGYPEGPQVPDLRVAEWQHALQKHLYWWDKVVARKRSEDAILTIAPEFGPFPYMVHHPESGQPIADQWSVNLYMRDLLRDRYY